MPMLRMRKLRHEEATSLPWSHTGSVMEPGPKQHLAQSLVCQIKKWIRELMPLVSLFVSQNYLCSCRLFHVTRFFISPSLSPGLLPGSGHEGLLKD